MKGSALRTVIIAHVDLEDVWDAAKKIRTSDITNVESGVKDEPTIQNLTVVNERAYWNGTLNVLMIFVTSG